MNKRVKMFLTSITLVLSLVVMVFSVLAASNYSLGVENHIIFDVEDNIVCEINAVTAVGNSPDVAFSSVHNNSKTLRLETDMDNDGSSFVNKGGNSELSANGVWEPWTEESPASVDHTNNTIYWIYKITNKSENTIQVRITDLSNKTLFTLNNNMRLIKKFGTNSSETPNDTESGEIEKDETVYVLIALETTNKSAQITGNFNYKLHIEKTNMAYLRKDWKSQFDNNTRDSITEIVFTGGTGEEYIGAYTGDPIPLGATDKTGETALAGNEEDYQNVNEIKGYISGGTLTVHSKGPIYAPVDSSCLFSVSNDDVEYIGFANLKTLTLSNFDTSNVTNMHGMINVTDEGVSQITELDLSNFDTSNVTDMSDMFSACVSLKSLNISNFDTSSCTNMSYMFSDNSELVSLDVSSFDTSNVTDMTGMFGYLSLTELDVSSFDTSNVTSMSNMFSSCDSLTELDVSGFDTSSVTGMSNMFSSCDSLTGLDVSGFDTSKVISMESMFNGCSSLTALDVSNFDTSDVTDMSSMFYGCSSLTSLDLRNFDTSNVTSMSSMFEGCSSLTSLDLSSFYIENTCRVTDMLKLKGSGSTTAIQTLITPYYVGVTDGIDISTLGLNCDLSSITTITFGSSRLLLTKASYLLKSWKNEINDQEKETITSIKFIGGDGEEYEDPFAQGNTVYYFGATNELGETALAQNADNQILGILGDDGVLEVHSKFPIYAPIDSSYLFAVEDYDCNLIGFQYLQSLTLDNLNTKYVKDMSWAFYTGYCCYDSCLTSLDISKLDTSNVENMWGMFYGCHELTELDVSNLDTSKVTDMSRMFYYCCSLIELDLSNFDTSNLTNIDSMFADCSSLTDLDLSNFDTSEVVDMSDMLYYCSSLSELDVSSFDTRNVTDMSYMFNGCSSLTELDLSSFYIRSNCDTLYMLDLASEDPIITTLVTPYYIGTNIDISSLEFNQSNLKSKDSSRTLIKQSAAYLLKEWAQQIVSDNREAIRTINFVGGDGQEYNQPYDEMFYLGATDQSGATPLKGNESSYPNLNQVIGYLKNGILNIHSKSYIFAPIDSSYLFHAQNHQMLITAINFNNFMTKNVTNMSWMFEYNYIGELDLSDFNTSSVEDMGYMFSYCSYLTKLDISNFNTEKVTNMRNMFYNCTSLIELDISSFYVGSNCSVSMMFNTYTGESSLTTLITPKYVGVIDGIDISNLGLSLNGVIQTKIARGYGSKTLTKAA